jgi:hypothetical protein
MSSSGMLRRVVLVRTDVSEERSVFIIRVTRIGELETLVVTSNPTYSAKNCYVYICACTGLENGD